MRKRLSVLLAACLLLAVFAGCKPNAAPPAGTKDPEQTGEQTGGLISGLPIGEMDYGGEKIGVYAAKLLMGEPWYDTKKEKADIVEETTWSIDRQLQEDLNVSLKMIYEPDDDFYKVDKMVQKVQRDVMGGTDEYRMVSTYVRKQGMMIIQNSLMNFLSVDGSYLQYDKPWWPDDLIDHSIFRNSLYYVGGDISNSYLYNIWAMFYNKDLMNAYEIEDPALYKVPSGEWTLDYWLSLCKDVRVALDGSEKNLETDTFGYICARYDLDAFYFGSDLNVFQVTDEGKIVLDRSFYSEKAGTVVSKITKLLKSEDAWSEIGSAHDGNRKDRPVYEAGRALFHTDVLQEAKNLVDLDTKFSRGVLPIPKYDENQQNYTSTCRPGTNRVWSILSHVSQKDALMCTAVLEYLGSESYDKLTPIVFERLMKLRYSEDPVSSSMFDYIRKNVIFDLGQANSISVAGAYIYQMPAIAMYERQNWSIRMANLKETIQNTIDEQYGQ